MQRPPSRQVVVVATHHTRWLIITWIIVDGGKKILFNIFPFSREKPACGKRKEKRARNFHMMRFSTHILVIFSPHGFSFHSAVGEICETKNRSFSFLRTGTLIESLLSFASLVENSDSHSSVWSEQKVVT